MPHNVFVLSPTIIYIPFLNHYILIFPISEKVDSLNCTVPFSIWHFLDMQGHSVSLPVLWRKRNLILSIRHWFSQSVKYITMHIPRCFQVCSFSLSFWKVKYNLGQFWEPLLISISFNIMNIVFHDLVAKWTSSFLVQECTNIARLCQYLCKLA